MTKKYFSNALSNPLFMLSILSRDLPFSYFLQFEDDILLACEKNDDNTVSCLVHLLQSYPELFYQTFQIEDTYTKKNTYIISHIIERGNVILLKKLIMEGFSIHINDFLQASDYNIFYSNNINHPFDKKLEKEVLLTQKWDDIIDLLVEEDLLPENKIEQFYSVFFHKPRIFEKAFSHNYFTLSYEHYWDKGLKAKNKSWMWLELINKSVNYDTGFSPSQCYEDFKNQAVLEYDWCNEQSCLYWPDIIIYHDNAPLLHSMIVQDKENTKKWFKNRQFKLSRHLFKEKLFSFLPHTSIVENHDFIVGQFDNPWSFMTQQKLPLTEDYIIGDYLLLNSIDYALLCQSHHCLSLLIDFIGFDTLLDNEEMKTTPDILKTFWTQLKLKQQLKHDKSRAKIIKI